MESASSSAVGEYLLVGFQIAVAEEHTAQADGLDETARASRGLSDWILQIFETELVYDTSFPPPALITQCFSAPLLAVRRKLVMRFA